MEQDKEIEISEQVFEYVDSWFDFEQVNLINNHMATTTIRGFLTLVGPVEEVGANKTKKQIIIVNVPPRKDDFDQVIGKPQAWEIAILGDSIEKLKVTKDMENAKVELGLYIDSYFVQPEGKSPFYSVNVNLRSIKILP